MHFTWSIKKKIHKLIPEEGTGTSLCAFQDSLTLPGLASVLPLASSLHSNWVLCCSAWLGRKDVIKHRTAATGDCWEAASADSKTAHFFGWAIRMLSCFWQQAIFIFLLSYFWLRTAVPPVTSVEFNANQMYWVAFDHAQETKSTWEALRLLPGSESQ